MKTLRRLFPRTYIKRELARLRRDTAALSRSFPRGVERQNQAGAIAQSIHELEEWQTSLDDEALERKAARIGVYLDEIEISYEDDPEVNDGPYHYVGRYGNRVLLDEFRNPLVQAIRAREPIYAKERREQIDLTVKLLTATSGFIGTVIGLVAVLRK
jgi:hypothetical protein